jgi:hypothetical protein
MGGPGRKERIRQDVADISSADELLRFALAGQLEWLRRRGYNQGMVAQGAGFGTSSRSAGPALTKALREGPRAAQLHQLDEIIGALDSRLHGTGGLSSLALRLSGGRLGTIDSSLLAARVPARWTAQVLANPPADEVSVLLQASAVLSEFMAAGKMRSADVVAAIHGRYERDLDLLVRRLILIAVSPPSAGSYDAQVLLGMLASYAFETLRDRLDSQLRRSPMSARVWPAVTKLVQLSGDGEHAGDMKRWVRQLMQDAEVLRKGSLYAGRGLDLELALAVPPAWLPRKDDWVGAALLTRARNPEATLRERGTAAMGLWQRALRDGSPSLARAKEELRGLISDFRDDGARPDAAAGLRWLAATLERVIDKETVVCNDWPDMDEDWFRNVQDAAGELDDARLPDTLLTGAKSLFRHMILQNAGVHRREAIETVVASGWSAPVARALGSLLEREQGEAWLRIRAEFALSFLQQHDTTVEADLTRACQHAYDSLRLDEVPGGQRPPRSHVTEMQCALFAVGDCFGAPGCDERARSARATLAPVLTRLAEEQGDRATILRRPARAAAYLLTMTAQPEHGGKPDLSRTLLEKLSQHPDPTTARLSNWVLSFRWADDGSVRPLLAAVEHGQPDDIG